MAGVTHSWRPSRPGPAVVAVLALVVVALTVTIVARPWAGPAGTASPSPSSTAVAGGSPSPGTSPSPTAGSPSPSPTEDPQAGWAKAELPPLVRVALLEPVRLDAAGVQPTTAFTLTSLTGETAAAMAARVELSPAAPLAILPADDTTIATLTPRQALEPGRQYRAMLRAPDGSLAASWSFRVRSPVRVLGTIPGDATTSVPVRAGIEVTFDQDGVEPMADHFRISPAVKGRFEQHGRTQVFVPDSLAAKTLYTVTVTAGLTRSGTDLALERDVVFRFETEGSEAGQAWLELSRDTVESSPNEAPVVGVDLIEHLEYDPDAGWPASLKTAEIRVYRLGSFDAATTALEAFLDAPRWSEHQYPLFATEGLAVVTTFSAPVTPLGVEPWEGGAIRFPKALPAGRYVVELRGSHPSHAFLQVTPVSAWVSVLTDRTVVWANDVTTGKPVADATATILGGATIGRADADGLIVGPTPDSFALTARPTDVSAEQRHALLVVRAPSGADVVVPFAVEWRESWGGDWCCWRPADETWWSVLRTDRSLYRQTDVVSAWGYVRDRDRDTVPAEVELQLVRADWGAVTPPPIVRQVVKPTAAGVFTASIRLEQLPLDGYVVRLVVDGRVVTSTWLTVDVVHKPAFELEIVPDHHAVITGAKVIWTTTARFFDGTPVPGLTLAYSHDEREDNGRETTDDAGVSKIARTVTAVPDEQGDATGWELRVGPAGPQESSIADDVRVTVFPSSWLLDLDTEVADGRLRVTGSLHEVDLAKAERQAAADGWVEDAAGDPVAGATVKLTVTEIIPVRTQVGTTYDFVEKLVEPIYEYSERLVVIDTLSVRTAADGRLAASVAIPDPEHGYTVAGATTDPRGRGTLAKAYGSAQASYWRENEGLRFETVTGDWPGSEPYAVGETVEWRLLDDGRPIPASAADRYLYLAAQRGLRDVVVSGGPTFERTFAAADAPNVEITGVRFTGTIYQRAASGSAQLDTDERAVTVTVAADRARYRPGEDLTVTVTTKDAAGDPIAATVVVSAVDEKIFAMGGAWVEDPLHALYGRVESGVLQTATTHQAPTGHGGEGGGDTTGGGGDVRSDFRDTLFFRSLTTGADGRATLTVALSDDLTSWHVTASAMTADLRGGVGEALIPVGLPVFVESTIADEYLVTDRPTILLRTYGDALRAGDRVVYTIRSSDLGLAPTSVEGTAFTTARFDLPALTAGRHTLDIGVTVPGRTDPNGKPLADRLVRTFGVVTSRLTAARTAYLTLGEPLPAVGGLEMATYTFTDAGRGRYLPAVLDLSSGGSARLDRGIAASLARDLLVDAFGYDADALPPSTFDPDDYSVGVMWDGSPSTTPASVGAALVPWGGLDPWLAARVAVMAPDTLSRGQLREALTYLRDADSTRRDLWIASVAGLASLGIDSAADLAIAAAEDDLTITERLYLGLGYTALGNDASAIAIERALLAEYGQQKGPWLRLWAVDADWSSEATAMLAVIAARASDPLADPMLAYIQRDPSHETTHALDIAAAVTAAIERTPSTPASFAYSVDGERTVVGLEAGETRTLTLTAPQRETLRLERLTGEVGLAIAWREPTDPASIPSDASIGLRRTVPSGPIPSDRFVTVTLDPTFRADAIRGGCYEIVETVPSGLVPVEDWTVGGGGTNPVWPQSIVGQQVTWCYDPVWGGHGPVQYIARVVNEGTFTWEPAVMQLEGAADVAAVTGATTVTIEAR